MEKGVLAHVSTCCWMWCAVIHNLLILYWVSSHAICIIKTGRKFWFCWYKFLGSLGVCFYVVYCWLLSQGPSPPWTSLQLYHLAAGKAPETAPPFSVQLGQHREDAAVLTLVLCPMHYGWGWNEMAGVRKGRESACPADKPQVALWKQGLSQELVDRMYCPDAGNDSSRHLPMPSWTVPSRASRWQTPQFPYVLFIGFYGII